MTLLPWIPTKLAEEIDEEIGRATATHGGFASLHEAWAVLKEELDEVWDITRQKRSERKREALREEFIQIAAMAIKSIESLDRFVDK